MLTVKTVKLVILLAVKPVSECLSVSNSNKDRNDK